MNLGNRAYVEISLGPVLGSLITHLFYSHLSRVNRGDTNDEPAHG